MTAAQDVSMHTVHDSLLVVVVVLLLLLLLYHHHPVLVLTCGGRVR
jgi:hypothetical protein